MKVFAFLCLLFSLSVSGQNLTLEPLYHSSLYAKGHNYFRFSVNGIHCDSISVSNSNGRIKRLDSCSFWIIPENEGEVFLSFYSISHQDTTLLGFRHFNVINPAPPATLYRKHGGVLSKEALTKASGFEADYLHWQVGGCGVSATIKSYRVLVLRGDSLVGTINVEAASFTDEVKTIFEKMESGDKVYFMDIWATSPLGDSIKLTDVSFGVQ